jgi:hypothetical protein
VCYAETPKILFIPPRCFLTALELRTFKGFGNEGLVVTHLGIPQSDSFAPHLALPNGGGLTPANSIRGMTVLMPHGPNHTACALLAHADPGRGLPEWGMKAAVGALVSVEPFRYFFRMGEGARQAGEAGIEAVKKRGKVGLSQLGYAGFWEQEQSGAGADLAGTE